MNNEAIIKVGQAKTMSSREIAELLECRHDNVKLSIERLMAKSLITTPALQEYTNSINRKVVEYLLDKRSSLIVVAQLSPEFTARVVDRWQELELQAAFQQLPDFHNPVVAARAWAEQVEGRMESEAVARQLAAVNAELLPKAEFHDAVTEATNCQSIQEVAKILKWGPNRLFKFLREEGILMRNNLPYQQHIDAGHFRVVERHWTDGDGEGHTYARTLVTGKGLVLIQRRAGIISFGNVPPSSSSSMVQ